MKSKRDQAEGFTLYQLLVSIVVLAIFGSLWLAYNKHKEMKQGNETSSVEHLRYG